MNQSRLIINTDGGSRGNPGPAAIGVYAEFGGACVTEYSRVIGSTTNNVAEYAAINASLDHVPNLLEKYKVEEIQWRLDSLLVVEQLNKNWKIKDANLQKLAAQVWQKLNSLSVPYSITHVGREFNSDADRLVNYALDNPL